MHRFLRLRSFLLLLTLAAPATADELRASPKITIVRTRAVDPAPYLSSELFASPRAPDAQGISRHITLLRTRPVDPAPNLTAVLFAPPDAAALPGFAPAFSAGTAAPAAPKPGNAAGRSTDIRAVPIAGPYGYRIEPDDRREYAGGATLSASTR